MITVKSAHVEGELILTPYKDAEGKTVKGVFVHLQKICLYGSLVRDGQLFSYFFVVNRGYTGNFASSPDLWLVQKIVPSYVADDPVYNEGFDLHDWLYSVCGKCTSGEVLERSEVDDLARGVMRESPTLQKNKKWVARVRCSVMDFAVGVAAGNKRHWGNDSYDSKEKASFYLVPVKDLE